jgi:hypothetical protein
LFAADSTEILIFWAKQDQLHAKKASFGHQTIQVTRLMLRYIKYAFAVTQCKKKSKKEQRKGGRGREERKAGVLEWHTAC